MTSRACHESRLKQLHQWRMADRCGYISVVHQAICSFRIVPVHHMENEQIVAPPSGGAITNKNLALPNTMRVWNYLQLSEQYPGNHLEHDDPQKIEATLRNSNFQRHKDVCIHLFGIVSHAQKPKQPIPRGLETTGPRQLPHQKHDELFGIHEWPMLAIHPNIYPLVN